ncbi:MAG TPA: glucose-6-phosphate isomerase, partial [Thermosynechococcaceae cyanobacterium]
GLLQGTRQALYENQRDSITVTLPDVTPRSIGALIALYERAVGLYGFLVNVNAYHQPGVEAGKKAAATILELQMEVVEALQQEGAPLSLPALATVLGATDQIETIYKIVRHLAANQQGVVLEGNPSDLSSLKASLT